MLPSPGAIIGAGPFEGTPDRANGFQVDACGDASTRVTGCSIKGTRMRQDKLAQESDAQGDGARNKRSDKTQFANHLLFPDSRSGGAGEGFLESIRLTGPRQAVSHYKLVIGPTALEFPDARH
jgi:hypothetical protein